MGYHMHSGRFATTEDAKLAPSASRTASGNGSKLELGDKRVARLKLDVTSAAGTSPTLDVDIECSHDGVNWYTSGSFAQATAVSNERQLFMLDRFVRAKWTLGGTSPDFTFSVEGEAV